MADTSVNQYLSQADDATARTGFVPDPPTPAADLPNGYLCFQRSDGTLWAWNSDSAAWVQCTNGSGANTVSAAGTLTSNALILGGGAKAVAALGSLGTTTTVLHGNAAGAPTFGAVALGADVSGDLPFANLTQGSALSVLGVTGNATADVASIAAGSDHQVLRRSGTAVAFGAVNLAQSAAVTGVLPVANGGTGSASGAAILQSVTNIVNADIKKLPSVPIELVAAPGANKRIKIISISVQHTFTVAAYTGIDATYCALQISAENAAGVWIASPLVNDTSTTPDMTSMTAMFGATGDGFHDLLGGYQQTEGTAGPSGGVGWWAPQPVQGGGFSNSVNKAVVLSIDNNSSATDLGGGNAAQSMRVVTYYAIEDVIP